MPKKKGHSRKTRHPGVGIPAQGKGMSKTTASLKGKPKKKAALLPCPTEGCDGFLEFWLLVYSTGKKRMTLLCKKCDLPLLERWWI